MFKSDALEKKTSRSNTVVSNSQLKKVLIVELQFCLFISIITLT